MKSYWTALTAAMSAASACGGRLIISNEIVANNSCGYGDGPLSDPEKVTKEIENAGFSNVSLEKHEENGEGIYLFRAENS